MTYMFSSIRRHLVGGPPLALPLHEPRPPPALPPQRASRRRWRAWIAAFLLVLLVALAAEKCTGALASVLDHEIFTKVPSRWKIFNHVDASQPRSLSAEAPAAEPKTDTEWSTGSAFVAVVVLQLSCVLQPAGSNILDGALGLWRISPLYCLWDSAAICTSVVCMVFREHAPLRLAIAVVLAARRRSVRTLPYYMLPVQDQITLKNGGVKMHILQDIRDAFAIPRKRRIMSAIVMSVNILQFVKVMSISGPFASIGAGSILAGIYFTYWLLNEVAIQTLGFSSHKMSPPDQEFAVRLAICYRPHWLFTVDPSDGQQAYRQAWNIFLSGLFHFSAAAFVAVFGFGIKTKGMEIHGVIESSGWAHFFGFWFYFLPLITLYLSLWPIFEFTEGFGMARWALGLWFSLQGFQVLLLVLLYHLCIYDSSQTLKPNWLDWLP